MICFRKPVCGAIAFFQSLNVLLLGKTNILLFLNSSYADFDLEASERQNRIIIV